MTNSADPKPRENLLKANSSSPMRFMAEHLVFDSEEDSLIRFRSAFIMPDWTGVEDNESDYVVENSWTALYHIAYEVYGDSSLHWVIAARNHMDLPDVQMYRGLRLKVPSKDWVERVLLPKGRKTVGK